MAEWTIYSKNGVAKATVKELELHDEWMAECFLTVSVKSSAPIDFTVGDYIDYRNERYSINYDPSRIKKARRDTYGEGFVYENIKFVAVQDELVRCDFCDLVLSDNQMHYTQLSTFPFYCETVDDLLDRIQANMEDLYPGSWIIISPDLSRNRQRGLCVGREQAFIDAYNQYIGAGSEFTYEKTGIALTVDNINCWEALAKAHSDFGLNFIVRGRIVIVGTAGVFTANTFKYGKGKGLSEIEVIGDSEQKVVTRLRAYGSEENLPERYYAIKNTRVFATVTEIEAKYDTDYSRGIAFFTDLRFSSKYFTYRSHSYPGTDDHPNYVIRMEANGHTVTGFVTLPYSKTDCYIYSEYIYEQDDDRDERNLEEMTAFLRALEVGDKVYFVENVDKSVFDASHTEATATTLPDNMAVNKLMLPGFPDMSLDAWVRANRPQLIEDGYSFSTNSVRPYIDSPNVSKYGIRPSSIYFDGSDETDDIHPTIEGMTYLGHACDVIVSAEQISDNGVLNDDAKDSDKRVTITIPNAGFEFDKEWKDGTTISMKDGMCGARDFKVIKKPTKDDDGNWICVCERNYDSVLHLYFPYSDFQIQEGDHFVLLGIDLPDSYVEAASIRLFDAAMDALRANEEPRRTFQPRIDHIWMQRQHDSAMASGGMEKSLHDTLKAGDMFVFQDSDLDIEAAVSIDVLTIRENADNGLPTYDITLRDEKTVSTIRKIQDKVSSMFSGAINGAGGGGSYNMNQLTSLLENYGREHFLSRLYDDEAAGSIDFNKNITVKGKAYVDEQVSSEYTGEGMLDTGYRLWYENGRSKLVIDDLVARGKFSVYNLESRIMTFIGGDVVFSGAGSKIFFVEYLDENENPLGYTTINSPFMLRDKFLLAGVSGLAAWSNRRRIQKQLSDEDKARVTKFRCYMMSDDGTMKTRNWWKVNDLARCQTFDHTQMKQTSEGYYSGDNVSNTVYWRRVAGIGSKRIDGLEDNKIYDYFDLWNVLDVQGKTYIDEAGNEQVITDSTPGYDVNYNDWPAAGDDLVQFGNAVDQDRRSMVVIEVTSGEPGMKVYNGVYTYSLQNCKWVGIGYDSTTKRAYADIFGDCYIGERGSQDPRDGSTYVRYNSSTKKLEIKAVINAQSPYGTSGKTIDEQLTAAASAYVDPLTNGLNSEHTYAGGAYTAASNAQGTANSALSTAYSANSTANAANSTANAAKTQAESAQAQAQALDYIKNALSGVTEITGGLMLTTLIALRRYNGGDASNPNNYTTWGGLNGAYVDGQTIAAWFGGGMVDHERYPSLGNYAKILFRMNGSGYMASGKFTWDSSGNATIGGFDIGANQLGALDYTFQKGWAFIQNDGYFSVNKLNASRTYSAEIYGGAAIMSDTTAAAEGRGNRILVNSTATYIYGNNVYIGTTNKAYYNSDEIATKTVSDIRMKDIIEDTEVGVDKFAESPLFKFKLKKRPNDRVHIGTSAQYWQDIVPDVVETGAEFNEQGEVVGDHLLLDYTELSYAGVVALAREVKRLRAEVEELKKQIAK